MERFDLSACSLSLVSVPELAAYWRVSETAVYRWIRIGALPATRIAGVVRVRAVDARAFEL